MPVTAAAIPMAVFQQPFAGPQPVMPPHTVMPPVVTQTGATTAATHAPPTPNAAPAMPRLNVLMMDSEEQIAAVKADLAFWKQVLASTSTSSAAAAVQMKLTAE